MSSNPKGPSAPARPSTSRPPRAPAAEDTSEVLALHTRDLLLPELRDQPPLAPTGDVTLVTSQEALYAAQVSHSGTTKLPLPGVRDSRPSLAPRPARGTASPPQGGEEPGRETAPLPPRETTSMPPRAPSRPPQDPRETVPVSRPGSAPQGDPRETVPFGIRAPAPSARSPQRPAAPSARSPQPTQGGESQEETKRVSLRRLMPGQFNARATYDSVGQLPLTGLTALSGINGRSRERTVGQGALPQETAAIVVVRRAESRLRGLVLALVALLLASTIAGVALYLRQQQQGQELDRDVSAALLAVQQRGDVASHLQARERLRALVAARPTDVVVQAALARTVAALRFEFGGHSTVPGLTEESQAAGYLVQTETTAAARAAQAYLALSRGDADAAAQAVRSLRDAAERGLADYLLGLTALLRGDPREAAERLEAAARAGGADASPLRRLWLARALRDLGQEDAAFAALQGVLRYHPDHPGARLELAWLAGLSGRGDRESHARALRTLAKDENAGTGERARAELALAALALQPPALSLPSARAALKEARALLPTEDVRLTGQLAALALQARDPEGAISAAQAALQRAPYREDLRLLLVRALLQRGRASEAQAELDLLGKREGKTPGAVADRESRLGSAVADRESRLGSAVVGREQRLLRGAALLSLDQTVPGQELLQALLKEEPHDAVATEARLWLLRSLQGDDLPEAQRLLQQLREGLGMAVSGAALQALQEAQLQEVRLWLLARPPRRAEALQALGALLDRAPYLLEARLQLGRLLREQGRAAEAVQQLREGLKLDEDSSAVRRELLQAALRSGELPLAEEQLAALLKREEDDELLLLAAQTRRQQGDAAGAEGFLQRVRPGRGGVTAAQRKAEHDAVQRLKASHR